MPRPNRPRSLASEANLAQRIAHEREQRGLSYEALARLMTEAGCSIQGSAIYKIEKANPPRRVTVDELVALSKVLGLSVDELLMPMEMVEQRQAQSILQELSQVETLLADATERAVALFVQYFELTATNPELREYIEHHWFAPLSPGGQAFTFAVRGESVTDEQVRDQVREFLWSAFDTALKRATPAARGQWESS
ncbi:hypothetical protein Vqi01_06400 [Micromonospora qiuiae]|uniref:HTH cro/C1-type domain-containing protein n=1 Tax=Micromonospora qiuiae TaxID=502268 RepID=A0ABQ4J5N7_9ACTN|nr:helix-turn-helix transcriptional regulator [Micromonospora qiuiae]GIJ25478.1 hypothetical protein Vqi01_06400 [Micromonospora qiuiae]